MNYTEFIDNKTQLANSHGFEPLFMPDILFDFQKHLVEWSVRKGRSLNASDCGLGKTFMELVCAQNFHLKTGKRIILMTPLAVGAQTVIEAAKIGVHAERSKDGKLPDAPIVIVNYERLHLFNPDDFGGAVCDESSILKSVEGATRAAVTEFMRRLAYRLLCTATAAPNDFVELGTSAEALGEMGQRDMLSKFFKKTEATISRKDENKHGIYRFRGHAERDFWRWVCSWMRAVRKPSDMGFSDKGFELPDLITRQHIVTARTAHPEYLFSLPAAGLDEQRKERARTCQERCEMAAEIANATSDPVISWCYLNREGDMLTKMIDGAVQVSGTDSDERKEEVLEAFASGSIRVLVTKPKIAGMGLNLQHCNRMTYFPSHSFEQWYQSIRRCWRFGQKHPVTVDVITSEGEANILSNLQRKATAADGMFSNLVAMMNNELSIQKKQHVTTPTQLPNWI